MRRKKIKQGIDGINFGMQLKRPSLSLLTSPPKATYNEYEEKIVEISITRGKVKGFCNLPRMIRPNNVIPYGVLDLETLSEIRSQLTDFICSYLSEQINYQYNPKVLEELLIDQLECNITLPCVGKCTPNDVMSLINIAISNNHDNVLYQRSSPICVYEKENTLLKIIQKNEYYMKIYNKSLEQQRKRNNFIKDNLLRIEIVFLKRRLERFLSKRRSLNDLLTVDSLLKVFKEYSYVLCEETIRQQINPCLIFCRDKLYHALVDIPSVYKTDQLLAKCHQFVVDIEVLREAIRKFDKHNSRSKDNSRQRIGKIKKKYELPQDVIKTIRQFKLASI